MADVAAKVVKELACKGTAAINLYYGEGVTDKDANALLTSMRKKYPRHDVEVYYGGQTHYYYFISVE
jgi:dihydroxyacetone kinase-like predicted kinase